MNKIISKRQVWVFVYSLVITIILLNYLRNISFLGGFDQASLTRNASKIGKTFVNSVFFDHYSQLEQIKSDFPDVEMSIQVSNYEINSGDSSPLIINPEEKISYPVLILKVQNHDVPRLKQKLDSLNVNFSYIVRSK